ncbi:histidinol-phosphate transaminase [Candidatus Enterococcus ferrettii]|uniref:Histidinol-phosphate aminotransferase n=1 Tax=Candidatus Enterococcus ferrettii TaxID=2815324 RepID=A0ABV0EYT4_9ENTE|nr:histidinol-phosphate transaminase [Enterococcus sp. 665A]MBO1342487.1 histidinol-phosphate transaminase [Enterococcus sp. 665A]
MNFLHSKYAHLVPYTPGEQPKESDFIKLNTNESPYEPAPSVMEAVKAAAHTLNRYSDTAARIVVDPLAKQLGVKADQVILGNGSDEILSFIFQAFTEKGMSFPDVTYGFYAIYCDMYQAQANVVPLMEDFTLDLSAYDALAGTVIIANPNAPTGLLLSCEEICDFLKRHPDRLLVVDEAYIDFGGQSMIAHIEEFDNLLVVGTFSKSRQLAGARLGYAVGNSQLIGNLNQIKYSVNPYNINAMTQAAGAAVLAEQDYVDQCIKKTIEVRNWSTQELKKRGFEMTDSYCNFLFAKHSEFAGETLFEALREQKILVRWFNQPRTKDYLRISIGTKEQMERLMDAVDRILEGAN